ncbi:MAG: competence/damage-inducible protein A [bacterium]|nr:MAG: competence/damage-inducible protein A [bacterium]
MPISRVGLAVIGDEVLMGEVADRNIQIIGREVFRIGADMVYAAVIPDEMDFMVRHLSWMREQFDWVVTTGGIGATHDDLTRLAVSRVTGRPLRESAEALRALEGRLGTPVPEKVRELAMVPEGAELITNALTAAPGFIVDNLIVLPGIPKLVESMMGILDRKLAGGKVLRRTILTMLYESQIAHHLEKVQAEFPSVKIGSYPEMGASGHRVRLVLRSRDEKALTGAEKELLKRMKE